MTVLYIYTPDKTSLNKNTRVDRAYVRTIHEYLKETEH